MQGAAREDVAVARAMREFEALAHAGELDEVFADDVAGADRGVARRRPALARGLAQRERGARGRVELARVVGLDDVAVPAGQGARGAFDQVVQHRDAEAEVAGPGQRNARGGGIERRLLRLRKAGRAGHQRLAALQAQAEDRVEAFGQAEVDGRVELRHAREFARRELRHAVDHARFDLARDRGDDLAALAFAAQALQRAPHAAVRAVDQQSDRCVHAAQASRPAGHRQGGFRRCRPGPCRVSPSRPVPRWMRSARARRGG